MNYKSALERPLEVRRWKLESQLESFDSGLPVGRNQNSRSFACERKCPASHFRSAPSWAHFSSAAAAAAAFCQRHCGGTKTTSRLSYGNARRVNLTGGRKHERADGSRQLSAAAANRRDVARRPSRPVAVGLREPVAKRRASSINKREMNDELDGH